MILRGWRESPSFQASVAALALSFAMATWTLARALRVDPIPDSPPSEIANIDHIRRGSARPQANIASIVENDVFSVDRSAPSSGYRMPGEADPNAKVAAEPEKPVMLGTAVATDGSHFATVQMSNGTPILVHVGDKVGAWTVRSIERGKIVLVTSGGARAEITVFKPGL